MNNLVELHNNGGLIKLVEDHVELQPEAADQIADFLKFMKKLKAEEDQLKKMILEEMEFFGVLKISTDDFTISYIAETDRETLDQKALKDECPDVYEAYCKMTSVKPNVRIKLK